MIEISHKQARLLLRSQMDRRLPEEQWAALQAHLENCAPCRAYQENLTRVEKNLRRTLRSGWETVPGPQADTPKSVVAARLRRQKVRHNLWRASLALAAVVVVFFIGRGILSGDFQKLIPQTAESGTSAAETAQDPADASVRPAPTQVPTARPGDFPDVVIYEARLDGKADGKKQIYLLNPGSEAVDLFDGSSNDSDPVWSPDGQWIAFISDRTGKPEVFVTALAGNKVVQLTDSPGVTWQGPLSWSADGKWLALTGIREQQGSQSWVYLVALDGTGTRALSGTRGGDSPEFSPTGDRLAFTYTQSNQTGVMIYHVETGEEVTASWPENPAALPPAPGSALDWSTDGASLVYVSSDNAQISSKPADGSPFAQIQASPNSAGASAVPVSMSLDTSTPGSQITLFNGLDYAAANAFDAAGSFPLTQSRWPGAYRAVSWTAGGVILYLEDLGDARANDKPGQTPGGCWTIQAQTLSFRVNYNNNTNRGTVVPADKTSVNGLCVEGGLDRESWTPDGRWVVVLGRLPGETQRSLYAVRVPGRQFGFQRGNPQNRITPTPQNRATPAPTAAAVPVGATLRLSAAPWEGALPRVRPQLLYYRRSLNIDPQPVEKSPTALKPSDLSQRPGGPTGQIVYVVQNNAMSVVVRANPDGTGGQVLAATQGVNRCPRFSPDAGQIALVAPASNFGGSSSGGGSLRQPAPDVTGPRDNFSSPNDEVFVMDADGTAVHPVSQASTLPGVGQTGSAISYSCPVWSPPGAPGGPYVVTLVNAARQWYLAVLPTGAPSQDNSAPLRRYVRIGAPQGGLGPLWSPDGRSLYVVQRSLDHNLPELLKVAIPTDPLDPLTSSTVNTTADWLDVSSIAMDPTGQALILVQLRPSAENPGGSEVWLRRMSFDEVGPGHVVGSPLTPEKRDFLNPVLSSEINLLYGSRSTVGMLLQGSPLDPQKAVIYRTDLSYGVTKQLASIEDRLDGLAWSPDGRYLVYSTESGLWGLDVTQAIQDQAGPTWLSPVPVQGLDWK